MVWLFCNIAITFILIYSSLTAAFDVAENQQDVIELYITPGFLAGLLVFISAAGFVRFLRLTRWIPEAWVNEKYMEIWFLIFVIIVVGLIHFFKFSWSK